jgi:hypothetical protein
VELRMGMDSKLGKKLPRCRLKAATLWICHEAATP